MRLPLRIAVLACYLILFSVARNDQTSPRALAAAAVKGAGCTNMVLIHFIVDAAISGVSATEVMHRVSDIGSFQLPQIAKW